MMRARGFTLIELMVVMVLIGLLLAYVAPRYFGTVTKAQESTLKHSLHQVRDAIDKYYSDHERYPDALNDLVAKRYLRAIPVDPLTERADTWVVVAPPESIPGKVYDIRSGARGRAQDGSDVAKW